MHAGYDLDECRLAGPILPKKGVNLTGVKRKRDVFEGLGSVEVCGVLDISEANQRVLLHRGRSRLRQVLETEFGRA